MGNEGSFESGTHIIDSCCITSVDSANVSNMRLSKLLSGFA